ncbi:hypothetical protein AB3S75_026715 [Citrus x aurantiifolia]
MSYFSFENLLVFVWSSRFWLGTWFCHMPLKNSSMLRILLAFAWSSRSWSRHKTGFETWWTLACLRNFFECFGACSPSRGRAAPGTLDFCLAIKQALRLGEPLHALGSFFNDWDSARLLVVEQILARLASVSP